MFKTNKKKNLIKSILIIFIILIPYFLSGQGESYSKKNHKYIKKLNHQNKYHQYHQNISLKKRIYNFFYQRKNYALIKRFFLKKKQFIIMNQTSETEYIFKKEYDKKALINFNHMMNQSLFKKELYNNIIKKIASCHFYLKKYDLAINFFKILLKDNIDAEENLFHLGMCYYLQSNDYFFFQKNRIKSIKIFLFLRKNYPNTKYLPKIDKMIYNAFLTLKKKKESIGMYYFNKKKYKSSVRVFKEIINDYQDVFNIQKDYIYMIISQVEKENSSFEETIKLHNTYLQFYLENENSFLDEINLSLPSKIKKQFKKIEINLILIKKLTKYLIKSNEFKKI
ncbi:tetratricopeptide repeat protein [Candidatus Karelsulcia muelleri]|uniref:tetratricopeptide repeat protein n=1 Tax=Candidatus Karelsulcia muelleri TaxID=336810 RepID=UPI0021682577|nr:tetratricopeptide repeat protein [Candidatus Karelsulcia muelleri]